MKGRIVVVKEYGKPFEIEEYDVPEPQPGAVLLRMTQAGHLRLRPAHLAGRPDAGTPAPAAHGPGDGTRRHRRD